MLRRLHRAGITDKRVSESRNSQPSQDNAEQGNPEGAPLVAQVSIHMRSNGEVEGPDDASGRTHVERSSSGAPDAAGLEPRADNLPQSPRRHYRLSRPPPTIVRWRLRVR